MTKKTITAIAAHDAGGARIVASYASGFSLSLKLIVASGPAFEIFKSRFLDHDISSDYAVLSSLDSQKDFVLTGTSYPSDYEKIIWKFLRSRNIPHAAYLDHWVNYRERFNFNEPLPDEIWVGDEDAWNLAVADGFPKGSLRLVPNALLEESKNELQLMKKPSRPFGSQRLLFLAEPISQDARDRLGDEKAFGFTEETIVKSLVDEAFLLRKRYSEIAIRPHPLDPIHKYDPIIQNSDLIVRTTEKDYLRDIANSDTVLSVESMGLVLALLAGREAVSIVPTDLYTCHLPQRNIRHVKHLRELDE